MQKLTNAVKTFMLNDPEIAMAVEAGYSLKDIINPRRVRMRMGAKIGMAQYRYGPAAPEVNEAIEEANRVSVMVTTARASYNRILRDGPPEDLENLEDEAPLEPDEPDWDPVWSAKPFATYRELQNIPEHWGVRKVVLIWRGEGEQSLRLFVHHPEFDRAVLSELTGTEDLPVRRHSGDRWDYDLRRDQYATAVSEED